VTFPGIQPIDVVAKITQQATVRCERIGEEPRHGDLCGDGEERRADHE